MKLLKFYDYDNGSFIPKSKYIGVNYEDMTDEERRVLEPVSRYVRLCKYSYVYKVIGYPSYHLAHAYELADEIENQMLISTCYKHLKDLYPYYMRYVARLVVPIKRQKRKILDEIIKESLHPKRIAYKLSLADGEYVFDNM
jgi:hypothetical protein